MGQVFFTADTHFGHDAIVKFCERPWPNSKVMDRALVRNWNSVIKEEDTVYILGDFTMAGPSKTNEVEKIVSKLNGTKILVIGNHDRLKMHNYTDIGFYQVAYPFLTFNNWYMVHDPSLAVACPKNSIVLSGHLHGLYGKSNIGPKDQTIIDVGVDAWNYTPVSYKQIIEEIENVKTSN